MSGFDWGAYVTELMRRVVSAHGPSPPDDLQQKLVRSRGRRVPDCRTFMSQQLASVNIHQRLWMWPSLRSIDRGYSTFRTI